MTNASKTKDDVIGRSINSTHNIAGISLAEVGQKDDAVWCSQGTDDKIAGGSQAGATVDPLTDSGARVRLNDKFEGVNE